MSNPINALTVIATICLLMHLVSCKNKPSGSSEKSITISDTSTTPNDKTFPQEAIADTSQLMKEPETVVLEFLKWDRDHRDSLISIQIVNNAYGEYDSTKFYSVNFSEAEKYLNTFRESGFVSSKYIDHWKRYYKKADEDFKADPQNDGPPKNFNYDFVMWSQEADEDLKNITKSKVTSKTVKENKSTILLNLPSGLKLNFILSKQDQHWLIDQIKNVS